MKKLTKKITVIVEKTDTGFSAYTEEGLVFTTGDSIGEIHRNMVEANNLWLEDQGLCVTSSNIDLKIDFKQFFQYYRVLNAKFLAARIGMNPSLLSQYVQGKKVPSKKQTERILSGIRSIGEELSNLKFT